nr:ABC transporter permease [Geotalea uraniireducens]
MENAKIINLELLDLALAYGLVLLAIGLARLSRIGQEGQMLWASVRMVFQLLAVGYLLHLVFAVRSPLAVIAICLPWPAFRCKSWVGGSGRRCRIFTGWWGPPCSSVAAG